MKIKQFYKMQSIKIIFKTIKPSKNLNNQIQINNNNCLIVL